LNWAVPEAKLGAVPVRRAIHVVIRNDHLALLPEQGATGGRTVRVSQSIEATVDPFVKALREHIQSWGTAGNGLYWQPILVFKSAQDGQAHAAALRRLLTGSGMEIAPTGSGMRD
jgi:hypothetical protein